MTNARPRKIVEPSPELRGVMFSTSLINAMFPGVLGHYQPPILGRPFPLEADLTAIVVQAVVLMTVSLVVLVSRRHKTWHNT